MNEGIIYFFRKHWDAVLASFTGCLFLYYFTRHSGIGLSPDSVMYESVAVNIRHHFSLTDFNGLPLVIFPAGYPLFLAICMLPGGTSILQAAPIINCFLFSGVIIFTSIIIQGYRGSTTLYKPLFLSVLACSPCLLEVYSMLWSETLFIFLVLLFIITAYRYVKLQNTQRLIVMAVVVALALVTRYAGITLLATGGFLLLFDGETGWRKKTKHLILFTAISLSLLTVNLLRNYHVAGSLTGVREKATHGLVSNIYGMAGTMADWFPFLKAHTTTAVIILGIIFFAGIITLFFRTLQQPYYHSFETIIACFFVLFVTGMLLIASVSRFEELSSRLLSPMYIPLLLVGSNWLIPAIQRAVFPQKKVLLIAGILFYAGFQYHQYQRNAEAWEGIKDAGIPGYAEDSWTQSPTVSFIRKNKNLFNKVIYSNANDAAYFLTGIHAIPLPHKEIASEVDAFLQQPSFYVIWFTDGENPDLARLDFVRQHKTLVSTRQFDDGAVYFFSGSKHTSIQ